MKLVKDIIFFLLITFVAFAWWMLVLLLISFLTLSVLHFTIEEIFLLTALGTFGVDVYYLIKKWQNHQKIK